MKKILIAMTMVLSASAILINCSNSQDKNSGSEDAKKAQNVEKIDIASEPVKPLEMPKNLNKKKVALGDRLFHDKRLSKDNSISCASCHGLDKGGTDLAPVSTGVNNQKGPINSPTVYNSSYNFTQFWDGRAKDLVEQADGPVNNPKEMGSNWKEVIAKLKDDKEYKKLFDELYEGKMTGENIQDAIAEFEKSLVTINSPFDKYLKGDASEISQEAIAGYKLFKEKGCTACHMGPAVGGTMFQKMGLVKDYFKDRGNLTEADNGRYNVTKNEADKHFFKVPSLRVAALTPPYFHDASRKTLKDAIKTMGKYQLGIELKDKEVTKIEAFLKSLVGEYKGKSLLK